MMFDHHSLRNDQLQIKGGLLGKYVKHSYDCI